MFRIELIERKVNDIDFKIIPLDNLSGDDFEFLRGLGGNMVEEIYHGDSRMERVRKCDKGLVNIDVNRIMVIKECILLWTILQGNLKKHPRFEQLCAWLNETKHTHKGELWLREIEVHEKLEESGPECLFGDSLEEAMSSAPRGGKLGTSTINAVPVDCDMSDEDLESLFDHSVVDLMADKPEEEIELTDVVKPDFEPDFEVKDDDPDPDFTVELEIEAVLQQLVGDNLPKSEVVA